MTLTRLGEITLGEALPSSVAAAGAITASVGITLPDMQAKLASLSLIVAPPTLATALQTAQQIIASIQVAIATGVPGVDIQFASIAELMAELTALIPQLQVQLAFATALSTALGAAGVHLYKYEGPVGQFGNELQAQIGSGFPGGSSADQAFALVLATTMPATWAAMAALFKTQP